MSSGGVKAPLLTSKRRWYEKSPGPPQWGPGFFVFVGCLARLRALVVNYYGRPS